MMSEASVALPAEADMEAIATAAGNGDLLARLYRDGRLYVRGVTQEALDAAVTQVGTAPPAAPRILTGEQFLSLWLPSEIAAAWAADPRLMAGAMKALAQNSVNLDSPECAQLLALAEAKGCITSARRARLAAGLAPE